MAHKWNTNGSDVFNGYNAPSALHIENGNMQMLPQEPGPSQLHIGSQPHLMTLENSYIDSNAKNDHLRSSAFLSSSDTNYHRPSVEIANINIQPQIPEQTAAIQQTSSLQSREELEFTCFVCSSVIEGKNFSSIKSQMNHSGAPCLVLLMDVLGYKFDDAKLHSQVVCKSCLHQMDIIDELQQTLTESKTDVRTKFLDTIQRMKLKYPRTDKMLKPRCLRCVQLAQTSARKKLRGVRVPRQRPSDEPSKRTSWSRDNEVDGSQALSPTIETEEEEIDVDSDGPNKRNISESLQPTDKSSTNNQTTVFDTDPAFFSGDEKLKVGTISDTGSAQSYQCHYCNTKYESALPLKMHVRVFHMPVLVYDNGQDTKYRMGIKLQNTSQTQLRGSEKPFACLFCESAYKLQSSLQSHYRENHSPNKPFQCSECKEGFRRPIELSRHRLYRCVARSSQQK